MIPRLGLSNKHVHPLYAEWRDIWRYYELSYIGGKDYIEPDIEPEWTWVDYKKQGDTEVLVSDTTRLNSFLFPYAREKSAFFEQRRRRSWYRNLCQPALDTVRDHALGESVDRDAAGAMVLEEVWKDVDGRGNTMDEWMREGMTHALIHGAVMGTADLARFQPGQVRTLFDEREQKIRPYGQWFTNLQMPMWNIDKFGTITRACFLEEDMRPDEEDPWRIDDKIYGRPPLWRVLFADHWELREGAPDGTLIDEGAHSYGRVPVEVLYAKRLPGVLDPIGQSFLHSIARVNQEIYNLDSMVGELEYRQSPFLVIPGGVGMSKAEIGLEAAFGTPEGGTPPSWVALPPHPQEALKDHIAELVLAIKAMAGLSRGSGEQSISARSGEALLVETQDKRAMLKSYRHEAEDFENRFARLMAQISGQEWDGHVKYSDKYMTMSFGDEVDETQKLLALPMQDKVKKEIVNSLVRKRLAHMDPDALDELMSEPQEAAERPNIQLAPTDAAKVIKTDEARSSLGLGPVGGEMGIKFLAELGHGFGAPPPMGGEEPPMPQDDADINARAAAEEGRFDDAARIAARAKEPDAA